MPKKRGAQSGNLNAFQHGFYAHVLPPIDWDPPPSPDINRLKTYAADTLEREIEALRVLIGRLAALQNEPDPEMKDPDAAFKTLLAATHRLDMLLRLQNSIQACVSELENAHTIRDIIEDQRERTIYPSDLFTVNNLEKIRLQLGGPHTVSFKQSLSAEDLQKYASLFEDPLPEDEDGRAEKSVADPITPLLADRQKGNE